MISLNDKENISLIIRNESELNQVSKTFTDLGYKWSGDLDFDKYSPYNKTRWCVSDDPILLKIMGKSIYWGIFYTPPAAMYDRSYHIENIREFKTKIFKENLKFIIND